MILLIITPLLQDILSIKELMRKGYTERTLSEAETDHIRKQGRITPKYFNKAYVTVTAAAKMLSHAHFGEPREVMGLLQGTTSSIKDPTMKRQVTVSLSSLTSSTYQWSHRRQG
jgi:hypothetical protein